MYLDVCGTGFYGRAVCLDCVVVLNRVIAAGSAWAGSGHVKAATIHGTGGGDHGRADTGVDYVRDPTGYTC